MIGPWIIALAYDIALYLWRSITYEIPVVGGRAQGRRPPRPPSLTERAGAEADTSPTPVPEGVALAAEEVDERQGVVAEEDTVRKRGRGRQAGVS